MIKLQVIGNIGKDAEVKTIAEGVTVVNFSVGVNNKVKERDVTTWVNVAKFYNNGQQPNIAPYIKKGGKIFVEGRPETRGYASATGDIGSELRLIADNIELLSSAGTSQQQSQQTSAQQPARQQQPAQRAVIPNTGMNGTYHPQGYTPPAQGELVEDLPF